MNIQTNKWIFQDDVTTPGNGNVFRTGRNDLVTVFITGTSSSRTIVFEGCDGEDTPNWYSLSAIKLPDRTIAESTTGTDEVWEIPLANFVAVRCRVSAVAGGTVRVTGRVVEVGTGMVGSKEVSLLASTNIAGKFGIDQTVPGTTNGVQVNSSALPTGASTEATLALIKAKTDNIPTDPSKESGKLTALETLITTLNGKIDTLDAVIDSIKDTDGIKKITDTVDVQLSGSNIEIDGVSFAVSGGDTLRNTAANKPNADAAHAAIPFCYYHAIDTGTVEATDGTNWVVI